MLPMELDPDDDLILRVQTSVDNADVSGRARVFRHGRVDFVPLQFPSPTSDRAQYNTSIGLGGGTLLGARISTALATAKRGQIYAQLEVRNRRRTDVSEVMLCKGYVYAGNSVGDGEFIEPGPGGGEGFRSYVTIAFDQAGNVDTLTTLGVANTHRRYHGLALLYDAAAVAATRTVNLQFRVGGQAPTGFATAANRRIWISPTLTLTTGEEGVILAVEEYTAVGDVGTVTTASQATAPNPFPYDAFEADVAAAEVVIGAGEASDVYSFYALVEEWLVL